MNNLVEIKDNHVVVSTVQIAEKFEKRHCDVLRLADAKLRSPNKDRLLQHFFKFNSKNLLTYRIHNYYNYSVTNKER